MTSPLFRHEVQIRRYDGTWNRSAWDHDNDGTFDSACAERDSGQELADSDMRYRVVTVLVPPVYELQLRTYGDRWLPSSHNVFHDGSWLGAMHAFQEARSGCHYRVAQVDA